MAPDIVALKQKHAAHILEVVRGAEKQEAVRQRKLRHATSKANLAYLQKRFDAERRQDQTHIAGLVHDANAVEVALRRGLRNGHHHHRNRPVYARGDSDSAGGSIGTTASSKSNAYVESEPKEDPNFISLDQMRFMKYVYAHVDDQKAARAHTRLMSQLVGAEKSADKLQERRPSQIRHSRGSNEVALAALGKPDVDTLGSSGRRREPSERGGDVVSQPLGGGGNIGNRQRLLEQKREILLEMKGVVCRQAEALDRLVDSNANVNSRAAHQAGGRGGGNDSRRRSSFQGSYGGGSTISSSLPSETEGDRRSSKACSKAADHHQSTRRTSCPDVSNLVVRNTPAKLPSTATRVKARLPLALPRPPENDTSAFLARGGRWGGESRQGTSRSGSLASASSASYATFCNRSGGGGGAALRGSSRRPAAVPALPLV